MYKDFSGEVDQNKKILLLRNLKKARTLLDYIIGVI